MFFKDACAPATVKLYMTVTAIDAPMVKTEAAWHGSVFSTISSLVRPTKEHSDVSIIPQGKSTEPMPATTAKAVAINPMIYPEMAHSDG
jgi:hypothetical protein